MFYIDIKQYDKAINLLTKTKFYFPREGEQTTTNLLQKAYYMKLLKNTK